MSFAPVTADTEVTEFFNTEITEGTEVPAGRAVRGRPATRRNYDCT
jgi:hypothetical protein